MFKGVNDRQPRRKTCNDAVRLVRTGDLSKIVDALVVAVESGKTGADAVQVAAENKPKAPGKPRTETTTDDPQSVALVAPAVIPDGDLVVPEVTEGLADTLGARTLAAAKNLAALLSTPNFAEVVTPEQMAAILDVIDVASDRIGAMTTVPVAA